MVNFTVAIPTYNSGDCLHHILEALRTQADLAGITWEVIVADNNSNDDTAKVVSQYQEKWPNTSQLKYLFEPTQGAGFARNSAAKAAKGELIGFLDDDVIPRLTGYHRHTGLVRTSLKQASSAAKYTATSQCRPPKTSDEFKDF